VAITRVFDDKKRKLLQALFAALGSDNEHESEAARGRIESLLREFGKGWADIIKLLGGKNNLRADLASDIAELGAGDPEARAAARRRIFELLDRNRRNWNDLVNVVCATSHEAWACDPLADAPDHVNSFDLVLHLMQEYIAAEPHEYVALTLWAHHTHVYHQFMVTPRLALRSRHPDSGKTTTLDILKILSARARKFDSITAAALYRLIDREHPAVLIDEADNLSIELKANGRLRAIFNSGHRKGGSIAITEEGELREYSTFAPLALALPRMYGLPGTLNSRCITIKLKRQDGRRKLRRIDIDHPDFALDVAYEQIMLWRQEAKLNPDPEMGTERNRFVDNWRVLISIADSLGRGEQARAAMAVFADQYRSDDLTIKLLIDIRKVFNAHNVDRLFSKVLLADLHELGWSEFWKAPAPCTHSPSRNSHTSCTSSSRSRRARSGRRTGPSRPRAQRAIAAPGSRNLGASTATTTSQRHSKATSRVCASCATTRRDECAGIMLPMGRVEMTEKIEMLGMESLNEMIAALQRIVDDCINDEMKPPFIMSCVSHNGSVCAVRFNAGGRPVEMLAEHFEDGMMILPINILVVDQDCSAAHAVIGTDHVITLQ
jgi:hypothetical protein